MTKKMTAQEAVRELRECDHLFLTVAGIKKFNAALGIKLKPYKAYANPHDPKGLTFDNGAKSGIGYDAADYAKHAAEQLGLSVPFKYGRGSLLRAACDVLAIHFSAVKYANERTEVAKAQAQE